MSVAVAVLPTTIGQRDRIESAIAAARQRGTPVLLTSTEALPFIPDPLAFLSASSDALGDGILWSQAGAATFTGAGVAHEIVAEGPGRFGEVTSALRELNHCIAGDEPTNRFPILGGFAFGGHPTESPRWRGFPGARFVVPRVLLQIEQERALLRVTQSVAGIESTGKIEAERAELLARARAWAAAELVPGSSRQVLSQESVPDRPAWESAVATAVSIIKQGTIDKVVLAREERVRADGPLSAVTTLAKLRAANPGATLFAIQAEGAWFIGATPERLVRLDRGRVDVSCLAGSIAIGASLEERERLAEQLLASEKDREEHEIVVRSTMAALAEVCEDLSRAPNTPRVVPARSVLHLESGLTGTLHSAGHVLDLVERLHPTPAVGGFPRDRALTIMRELEETERGWYAGSIGWTDLKGSGEFAVAIRSALLTGSSASLYAGCGIVAGSRPAEEFIETRLKLEPMLAALGAR